MKPCLRRRRDSGVPSPVRSLTSRRNLSPATAADCSASQVTVCYLGQAAALRRVGFHPPGLPGHEPAWLRAPARPGALGSAQVGRKFGRKFWLRRSEEPLFEPLSFIPEDGARQVQVRPGRLHVRVPGLRHQRHRVRATGGVVRDCRVPQVVERPNPALDARSRESGFQRLLERHGAVDRAPFCRRDDCAGARRQGRVGRACR